MKYEPTKQSIKQHEVPDWFNNAKLGIFIHWGIYSVPAFAITGIDLNESMKRGIEDHFKNNPYAEWYLNTLKIKGSPTREYHEQNYGEDFKYDDFVPIFNEEIKKWNPNEMAELFKKAGARY
ncbi:MAG: alpha-L-fucosidase, partial [Promethearchaeota archaeon]